MPPPARLRRACRRVRVELGDHFADSTRLTELGNTARARGEWPGIAGRAHAPRRTPQFHWVRAGACVTDPEPWARRPGHSPRAPEVPMPSSRLELLRFRAAQMRRAPTPPEEKLFEAVRRGRLGVTFRRQVPIAGRFIADFYASSVKLVVEVDGAGHDERRRADARRDKVMADSGFTSSGSQRDSSKKIPALPLRSSPSPSYAFGKPPRPTPGPIRAHSRTRSVLIWRCSRSQSRRGRLFKSANSEHCHCLPVAFAALRLLLLTPSGHGSVRRHDRLGGILEHYRRKAA